jgi:opacity protein-like surface antigen
MKKSLRLSSIYLGVITASILSTAALAGNYKGEHHHNLKGERVEAPCPPPAKMLKDGFYVGAQAGYDSYRVRQTSGVLETGTTTFATDLSAVGSPFAHGHSDNPVLNATGFGGGLFLGYGQYIQDLYYLGGEIWANGTNAQTNYNSVDTYAVIDPVLLGYTDTRNIGHSVKGQWSWGVSILPGIKVNESTLAYARLGYARHQIKTGLSDVEFLSATLSPDGLPFVDGVSTSGKNWFSGFAYGLGMETVICQNWSVRGDYTHTNLGSNSNNVAIVPTVFSPVDTALAGSSKSSASDNQFMLSLIYHFDLNNMFA